MKKYSIGLDIGTSSVGWAVVDEDNYEVMKKGKKSLWGVRLFDEATTAELRRTSRSTRRRFDRRRERIRLLQEEFKSEIDKVDKDFFVKMKESFYNELDVDNKKHPLSDKEKLEIIKYNENYPTIYHLRNELINNKEKKDIRLVYLAIHHIIKYRGNFLQEGKEFNIDNLDIKNKLREMFISFTNCDELEFTEEYIENINYEQLEKALLNPSKNDKKLEVDAILKEYLPKKSLEEFKKVVVGYKFDVAKIFNIESDTKLSISLEGTDFDDKYNDIEAVIGEKIETLNLIKELYDMIYLKNLFKDSDNCSLSSLMVSYYDKHKEDLRFLKDIFNYVDRTKVKGKENKENLYDKIFRTKRDVLKKKSLSDKVACLYDRYIHNGISYEDFIKELNKYLGDVLDKVDNQELLDRYTLEIKSRMENGEFLPRITSTSNGKYPYQLNKSELINILENQGKYYPFLLEKTGGEYKLVKLLEFRIPYYVGPLIDTSDNKEHPFAWMEKKVKGVKITPYNFDEIVDKDKSAEKFITKMVGHCSYLLNEIALPSNSLLYSEFKVRNELKQIKVNDYKLTEKQQNDIIEGFFKKTSGTLTDKKFKNYLKKIDEYDMYKGEFTVTGYSADGKFANNLQTHVDFFGENGFFKDTNLKENDAEEIIEWITIFTDKDILIKKIKDKYNLSDEVINRIAKKNYKGWGNLSRKLLTEKYYYDESTSTKKSIIDLMKDTDKNFMQIINEDKYGFQTMISEYNVISDDDKLDYKIVEELATSPAVKRGIWQALRIVEELVDYIGYEPNTISIEMARGEDGKKERKVDRKKYLTKIYEEAKEKANDYNILMQQLRKQEKIDSDMLYLYFLQEGKCLYTGKPLDINNLSKDCEIDHILPRTLIKDDSFNNRALVLKECNQIKKGDLVLPNEFRTRERKIWWSRLNRIGLMTNTKLYRLTRSEYKDEDIKGFINRQLVETRQITKHVANILGNFYKDSKIIYLKANLSHNYREKFGLYKFRELNDYHHAYDAYLASVLGIYKDKRKLDNTDYNKLKELNHFLYEEKRFNEMKYGYIINSIDRDFIRFDKKTGEVIEDFDVDKFINTVEKYYYRNDILISRKTEIKTGQFYKQTIYKKNIGNIPVKADRPVEMYGGYSNMETSYLCLVKYGNKQKMIGIPIHIDCNPNNKELKEEFIRQQLKIKNDEEVTILNDIIPFDTEIIYNNQPVYIKGYGVSHKNCELSNAYQLKIKKVDMMKWKNALNYIINNKIKNKEDADKYSLEIINYLLEQKDEFPLFEKEIDKIKNSIDLNKLTLEEQKKLVIELLNLYHCNSKNANLKDFGLSDRIGRLSGFNITNGVIINKSSTGLKEKRDEF